ncbi:GTPase Era [Iodidimonas sp. SYSU 1G8]|uniref:GTPase Era n=1 Tax=Iodidimonas sp. SYSU 1G8 TaxID=3133967 RepID=UPI0031FEA8A3
MTETTTRCGFVALLGAPNAGKSTLLNALVGQKISIVTQKVQTTRTRIRGIAIEGDAQLVYVDTPGIFTPKRRLDRAMVAAAWGGASDADVVCLLIDAKKRVDAEAQHVIDGLKEGGRKAVLILTKVDLVRRESLLSLADELNQTGLFSDIFMISAVNGDGIEQLKTHFAQKAPLGPWLYPEDQLSDIPMRLMGAEITREKLFLRVHQELPYAATVETEQWDERKDGSVAIHQVIFVERDSQKPIVIGKGGRTIKEIGEAARRELEEIMSRKVHLFLNVKVRKGWGDERERYREMGLDFSD